MAAVGSLALGDDLEEEVVIVGSVVAVQWDEEGNVVDVEIVTDHDIYLVELEGLASALLDYAGEVVSIRGQVYTDEDGWMIVRVISFTIFGDQEE
jgi:hypothetical protein